MAQPATIRLTFQDFANIFSALLNEDTNNKKFESLAEIRQTIIGVAKYSFQVNSSSCHELFNPIQNISEPRKKKNEGTNSKTNWAKVMDLAEFVFFKSSDKTNRVNKLGRLFNHKKTNSDPYIKYPKLLAFFMHKLYDAQGKPFSNRLLVDLAESYVADHFKTDFGKDLFLIDECKLVVDHQAIGVQKASVKNAFAPDYLEFVWPGVETNTNDNQPINVGHAEDFSEKFSKIKKQHDTATKALVNLRKELKGLESMMRKVTQSINLNQAVVDQTGIDMKRMNNVINSGILINKELSIDGEESPISCPMDFTKNLIQRFKQQNETDQVGQVAGPSGSKRRRTEESIIPDDEIEIDNEVEVGRPQTGDSGIGAGNNFEGYRDKEAADTTDDSTDGLSDSPLIRSPSGSMASMVRFINNIPQESLNDILSSVLNDIDVIPNLDNDLEDNDLE